MLEPDCNLAGWRHERDEEVPIPSWDGWGGSGGEGDKAIK